MREGGGVNVLQQPFNHQHHLPPHHSSLCGGGGGDDDDGDGDDSGGDDDDSGDDDDDSGGDGDGEGYGIYGEKEHGGEGFLTETDIKNKITLNGSPFPILLPPHHHHPLRYK